ncbi:MAG: CotH kinase family protein, partial [Flavobacteriales bacterium]|nr:CotH kinase family protein [Flavobacteriales bacterium]
ILADRLELYEGEEEEVDRFGRFLSRCERWAPDDPGTVDSLMKRMDADGFLHYMAAQIILANTDWPEQNVKWWRYTGSPDTLGSPLDCRWRFIMGDSDMGMGMAVPPTYDMCRHITARRTAPVARLLVVCLRIPALRERFRSIVDELLTGPLSAERMTAAARSMHDRIAREMPVHIARWRRPLSVDRWEAHVADVLTFAQQRPAAARAEVQAYLSSFTTP